MLDSYYKLPSECKGKGFWKLHRQIADQIRSDRKTKACFVRTSKEGGPKDTTFRARSESCGHEMPFYLYVIIGDCGQRLAMDQVEVSVTHGQFCYSY